MRRVNLQTIKPPGMSTDEWIAQAFAAINEASIEDAAGASAEPFEFDDADVTETTTFDPASASATDIRNVVSTFLMYLRRGGPSKTQ